MTAADRPGPRALRLARSMIVVLPLAAPIAAAHDADAGRGLAFARAHCARCHAVAPGGSKSSTGKSSTGKSSTGKSSTGKSSASTSPMQEAPPFQELAGRIPVDDLADFLVEGIAFRHPAMPEFRLDPDDASNLTAYLKSLRR